MDRDELKKHIFQLQDFILQEQSNGKDIDATLHSTTYNGFGEECVTALESIKIIQGMIVLKPVYLRLALPL